MHPVDLRGLAFDGAGEVRVAGVPFLVEGEGDDVVGWLLACLRTADGRARLHGRAVRGGLPTLFQPVHRRFQLALFTPVCAVPGAPTVARGAIESAGMVVRRVVAGVAQGWFRREGALLGWRDIEGSVDGVAVGDLDPDASRRRGARSGDVAVDAWLAEGDRPAVRARDEATTVLYLAPPDVCAAVGRTVLYGVIQTASGEAEELSEPLRIDAKDARNGFPPWLLARRGPHAFEAIAGRRLSYDDAVAAGDSTRQQQVRDLVNFLRQLRVQYRGLGAARQRTESFHRALADLELPYRDGPPRPASEALEEAARILLDGAAGTWEVPSAWPTITSAAQSRFLEAAREALSEQSTRVLPRVGRFDAPAARYALRGFARVREDRACRPHLVWSDPSDLFRIAPWHEPSGRPPALVPLPDLSIEAMQRLVPDVTFVVPPRLQSLLASNSPEDFLKGRARRGVEGGVQWLCGFNIPLITVCAFIVLNIFLVLFNLVFFWLPFIKVCIPLPGAFKKRLEEGVP